MCAFTALIWLSRYVQEENKHQETVSRISQQPNTAEVTNFDVYGEDAYLLTHKNAPRFKIVRTSLKNPDFSKAEPVVAQSDMIVKDMFAAKDALYVQTTDGGIGKVIPFWFIVATFELLKLPNGKTFTIQNPKSMAPKWYDSHSLRRQSGTTKTSV